MEKLYISQEEAEDITIAYDKTIVVNIINVYFVVPDCVQ